MGQGYEEPLNAGLRKAEVMPEILGRKKKGNIEEITEDDAKRLFPLSPNQELEQAFFEFQLKYEHLTAEELPDVAYNDYRQVEDAFIECYPPTIQNVRRMEILRDVIQRYSDHIAREQEIEV